MFVFYLVTLDVCDNYGLKKTFKDCTDIYHLMDLTEIW